MAVSALLMAWYNWKLFSLMLVFVPVIWVLINIYRCFFFFNDTATTEIYTLSLHDALPILDQASTTVAHVNSNLERVDDITGNAANVSSNVAALSSVAAATLGSPLIKVAAFSYGVRSAARKKREGQAIADAAARDKAERRARRVARRAA